MPYAKCKIYSDGSHYIAIPHKPQRPRPKKGAKVKKEVPEMEELDEDESANCPFDKSAPPVQPVQLSLFDGKEKDDKQGESEEDGSKKEQTCEENEDNTAIKPSRKEIFEQLYRKHINDNYKKRKRAITHGLLPHSKDYDDAKLFTELNLRRKRNNLIARRIRMTRKANLQVSPIS